jgi:hypothetical protein
VTQHDGYAAHFNAETNGVIIEHLDISDREVFREAQRWTTGGRGPIVDDPDLLAAADLTNFVTEAMHIGAHALSATGQARDSRALDQMLKDVGVGEAISALSGEPNRRLTTIRPRRMRMERPESTGAERARRRVRMRARRGQPVVSVG